MGRGGGGRSSFRAPRARAPAPAAAPKGAPAPAVKSPSGGSSIFGSLASAVADGWGWGAGMSMANRAMDAVFGPRTFRVEHITDHQATAPAAAAAAVSGPSNACDIHAQAFQDCINHNGSDISKCQFYVDVLNDCRRRGQATVVETY